MVPSVPSLYAVTFSIHRGGSSEALPRGVPIMQPIPRSLQNTHHVLRGKEKTELPTAFVAFCPWWKTFAYFSGPLPHPFLVI